MKKYLALLALGGGLWACGGNRDKQQQVETVSRGEITVAVDESLEPILKSEQDAFMAKNKYATIHSVYVPELAAIQLMLQDSARVAVVTRNLRAEEMKVFTDHNLRYRAYQLATDAVAFIVNEKTPDTLITRSEIRDILDGKIKKWSQLRHGRGKGNITLVFDNANSSNLAFLTDTLQIKDKANAPIYAVKNNQEVIEYVQKNPGVIGVIGVNWISDTNDPQYPKFMKGIRVMAVGHIPSDDLDDYYQPFQYTIALKKYALARPVYLITKEARRGLGTGYINYMLSDPGQRIILKSGLLPATQLLRLIQIKNF